MYGTAKVSDPVTSCHGQQRHKMILAELTRCEPWLAEPAPPVYAFGCFVTMDVCPAKYTFTINIAMAAGEAKEVLQGRAALRVQDSPRPCLSAEPPSRPR